MAPSDALARTLAFTHAIEDRVATRVEPVVGGHALLHEAYPDVWDFNFVRVERPSEVRDTAGLLGDTIRVLEAAGCAHCQIRVEDAALAERVMPGLVLGGLTAVRHAYLVRTGPLDRQVDTSMVREVDEATLRSVRERSVRTELPDRTDDVVRQLVDLHGALARATTMHRHAVFVGNEIAAYCSVFVEGEVAQIEEVMTLPEHRGKGHGRALLTAAIEATRAYPLVFIVADEDDWPLGLYGRLGFEVVGRVYVFNGALPRGRPPVP